MRCTSGIRWRYVLALALMSLVAPATAHGAGIGANGRIVFASDRDTGDGRFQIYSMNSDGSDVTRLTSNSGSDHGPAWSPGGTRIAFARAVFPQNAAELYVMNADGSAPTRVEGLGQDYLFDGGISWSPEGQKVVVAAVRGPDITIVDVAGGGWQKIGSGRDVAMSPDGQKIAFRPSAQDYLYTINPDGSERTYVPSPNFRVPVENPAWRPDSITLAFTAPTPGFPLNDIYSVSDSSGDSLRRLTNEGPNPEGADNRGADWSPDGEKIVYESDGDIYSMDADGANPTPITTGPAEDREPSWQPVPPAAVEPGYPRPKGATPVQASLAIAYRNCFAPDREHAPPLTGPSCSSPVPASDYLTVGTLDSNGLPAKFIGLVTLYARPGNPATLLNEADVKLTASLTDVRCKAISNGCPNGALSDYAGSLGATFNVRITDKFNTGPRPQSATVTDISAATTPFRPAIPCTPTADTTIGSTCEVTTTFNAVLPSAIRELKRTIWEVGRIEIGDGGDDGNGATTDDNTPFAREGFFVP
jgi:Tol biopolymer transport system component